MTPKEEAYKLFEELVNRFKSGEIKIAVQMFKNIESRGIKLSEPIKNELEVLIPLMFQEMEKSVAGDIAIRLSTQGKKYLNEFSTTAKLIQDIERESAAIYNDYSVVAHITGDYNQVLGGRDNALASPIQPTITNTIPNKPKSRSWLEIISWIAAIISGAILIYEFLKKVI